MNLIEAERLMDVKTEKGFCGKMAIEEHARKTIKESYGKRPSIDWIKLTTTRLYRAYYNKEISRFESV